MNFPDNDPRILSARQEINPTGPASRLWQMSEAAERAENPDLGRRPLIAMVGRRMVRMLFLVLMGELRTRPGEFTSWTSSLANGMVFEIGESLQPFPFEERVRAFEGLSRMLAAGLQIGLAETDDANPGQE